MFWGNKNIFNFQFFSVPRINAADFFSVLVRPTFTAYFLLILPTEETVKGDKSFRIEGRFKTKLTTKKNWMSWFKHYQWHWFERCLKLVIFLNCFPSVSRTLHSLTEMSRYHCVEFYKLVFPETRMHFMNRLVYYAIY